MNPARAVPELIRSAQLQIHAIFSIQMQEIIPLNQRVRELCVRNPAPALADPILDELPVEQLRHRETFPDFPQERQIIHILKPVVIVNHH